MNAIQQTAFGLRTLMYLAHGLVPVLGKNETVNEALGIHPGLQPNEKDKVRINSLIFGAGGEMCGQDDGTGISSQRQAPHTAEHGSPFVPMVVLARPADQDITPAERNKYCLRKEETHNGENWIMYYGYRLDITQDNFVAQIMKVQREDGIEVAKLWEGTAATLKPTPTFLDPNEAIVAADTKLRVSAMVRVKLSARDVEEYVNAAKVRYNGDETKARITEIGICMGADRSVISAGNVQFVESIATHVYAYIAESKTPFYNKQELTFDLDMGASIPLLSTASLPTIKTIP